MPSESACVEMVECGTLSGLLVLYDLPENAGRLGKWRSWMMGRYEC